jgi:hypothetical protein
VKQPHRSPQRFFLNALTICAVAAVTWLTLRSPIQRLLDPQAWLRGRVVLSPADEAEDITGMLAPIRALDSSLALVLIDAKCVACRSQVREYASFASQASAHGIAVRIVAANPRIVTRQYARLLGNPGLILRVRDTDLFSRFGVSIVPTVVLVDSEGRLLRYWRGLPSIPGPPALPRSAGAWP